MSVYKPPNSTVYLYDFRLKGRRLYGSTGKRTKRLAEAFEAKERAKAKDDKPAERPPITLDEACGLRADKTEQQPSWPTSRYILASMVAGLGAVKLLSEITQRQLELFVAKRRDGRSNATVNREIEEWRAVWRGAMRSRFDVGEMPDWGALMLKVPRRIPRELSNEEEDALLPEVRVDLLDFCRFALKSGWRRKEVLGLR